MSPIYYSLLINIPGLPVNDYPSHFRALRNNLIHDASSIQSSGRHECCTALNTRSGCGIIIVKRPSSLVRPVIPSGEPFGLAGYCSVIFPWLSTYFSETKEFLSDFSSISLLSKLAFPSPCATAIGILDPAIPSSADDEPAASDAERRAAARDKGALTAGDVLAEELDRLDLARSQL